MFRHLFGHVALAIIVITLIVLPLLLSSCGHQSGYPGDGSELLWKTIKETTP